MPIGLRNAERERLLGQMWKSLSTAERSAHKARARSSQPWSATSGTAERAPTAAPTSGTPYVAPPMPTPAAPLAFSGAGQTLGGAPGAITSPSSVSSGAFSAAATATTRELASLDAAKARRPCHRMRMRAARVPASRTRFARRARAAHNLLHPRTTSCTHHLRRRYSWRR